MAPDSKCQHNVAKKDESKSGLHRVIIEDLIACLTYPFLVLSASSRTNNALTVACAFCDTKIPFGQSACPACMKKYNIQSYDLTNDGCGCDK